MRLTSNNEPDQYPEWSPDGSKIVIGAYRFGDWDFYVMNADGSDQTNLTSAFGADSWPSWSTDGSQIVFQSFRDGVSQLYRMSADGTGQSNLSNNLVIDYYQPFWAS